MMELDAGAKRVLERLAGAGYRAYAVGGCVRDSLLGRRPQDWDICTSALPEQTIALFGREHTVPTGLQHGTVSVKEGGALYEVTTFRTDGSYSDGRHPDSVSFIDEVTGDLARRDFTINAMAYNDAEGLIDPFGGREDLLAHRVVRAVGEPMRRFEEDALRIMRLFRFAAREGLRIDERTLCAAMALCANLSRVSPERILEEMSKLLVMPAPGAYMPRKVVGQIVPQALSCTQEDYARALAAVDAAPAVLSVRFAALLCGISAQDGAEKTVRGVLAALRASGALTQEVCLLARMQGLEPKREAQALRVQAKRLLGEIGLDALERLAALRRAQRAAGCALLPLDALAQQAALSQAAGDCCRMKELAADGQALMQALSLAPGRHIGRLLAALLDAVIEEEIPNERGALIARAAQLNARWAQEEKR